MALPGTNVPYWEGEAARVKDWPIAHCLLICFIRAKIRQFSPMSASICPFAGILLKSQKSQVNPVLSTSLPKTTKMTQLVLNALLAALLFGALFFSRFAASGQEFGPEMMALEGPEEYGSAGLAGGDLFESKRAPLDRAAMVRFGKRAPLDRAAMVRFGKRAPLDRAAMVRFGKRAAFDRSAMVRFGKRK